LGGLLNGGLWQAPIQPLMRAVAIVVTLKIKQLRLKIGGRPEEHAIEILAPNRPDQSLDEGMRKWNVRNRLISVISSTRRLACHWWYR
jgi:hypothetical protein